ncbi:GNAT family N-acetyltransferase [Kitasatospora sp. NPDC002227]|uniref:GNAT family N-acetyltransferase n=1 Tax=Kitasatospora sp. NPDC002227 TaxID=3154773 RepID=UPI0033212F55
MSTYQVRLATPDDVPALMELRTEAEQWLAEMGVDQWSDPDLGERAIQSWLQKINLGMAWVFLNDAGRVAATVSRGDADLDFWTEDDDPQSAFYIYKLIVSRSEAGNGLGGRILDWASLIAAAEGKSWLRLDVWRNNKGLQRYYQKAGFDHVRTEAPSHRLSGWLGQRRAGTVLHPDHLLPTILTPLPSDFHEQLAAIQAEVKALSDRVATLCSNFGATSTPANGALRWAYDSTEENLGGLNHRLREAVRYVTNAADEAQMFPPPFDQAWASAPRPPIEHWAEETTSSTSQTP